MSIEVGNKLKGKITGIKNFGAIVENTWRIDAGIRHNF